MERKDFHHPFEPYDIQQRFMEAVYDCIENSRVGILESPTGTGKSLSLICGSLTWLREHKRKKFDEEIASIQLDDDDPQWLIEQAQETRRREIRQMRADLDARIQDVREKENNIRNRWANEKPPTKRMRMGNDIDNANSTDDDQYVLDDYESDDETASKLREQDNVYSAETMGLLDRLGIVSRIEKKQLEPEAEDELKIFFCSRTHSQLSQLVGELQRVNLPSGLPPLISSPAPDEALQHELLKHIPLGSRKNLCINPKVAKLQTQTAVNERCIELQQSNTPSDQKCPYMPLKENQDTVLDFRDYALAKIRDIEDLAIVGSKLQICPYYASRAVISPAEIVTLPYPLLLQKSAREALGISLKNHVVIIDEAHNLIDAIEGIYSAQVTEQQLNQSRESLMLYSQRFRNRLKGKNRVYVAQTIRVVNSLLECIAAMKQANGQGGQLEVSKMLAGKSVDQINLAKLVRYINDSKLSRKVEGYISMTKRAAEAENRKSQRADHKTDVPTLMHVNNFFMALMNPSTEGSFFWSTEHGTINLKYLLLDPSEHFREVVESSRSVILAGGTMSPMEDHISQLFPYANSVFTLSCGHLIPETSLLVRTVGSDAHGEFEFSFKARASQGLIARVGRVVMELAQLVQGGLVIFFPSYGYLEEVLSLWKQNSVISCLHEIKPVFTDGRGFPAEEVFKAYGEAITADKKGAILLSVIGGKLSEGINFADDLGRCVLVVGLPFPNLHTPEWKAKAQYLEDKATLKGEPPGKASREHASNACMGSVNQAIGRVIRHKGDWASVLLMDHRYSQSRIRQKLPGWVKDCLPEKSSTMLVQVLCDVKDFFRRNKG